jgi:hypothetical protein
MVLQAQEQRALLRDAVREWLSQSFASRKLRNAMTRTQARRQLFFLTRFLAAWANLVLKQGLARRIVTRMRMACLGRSVELWACVVNNDTDRRKDMLRWMDLESHMKKELEDLQAAATKHVRAKDELEHEAKVITRTLLRDLKRQQEELTFERDKGRGWYFYLWNM